MENARSGWNRATMGGRRITAAEAGYAPSSCYVFRGGADCVDDMSPHRAIVWTS